MTAQFSFSRIQFHILSQMGSASSISEGLTKRIEANKSLTSRKNSSLTMVIFESNHLPQQTPHFQDASWNEAATLHDTTANVVKQVLDKSWRKIRAMNALENDKEVGGISVFLREFVVRLQANNSDEKFKKWLQSSRIIPVMLHMVRFVISVDPSKNKVCCIAITLKIKPNALFLLCRIDLKSR